MRNYPKARRDAVADTYFGVRVTDPYRYLEDPTDPETIALTQRENAYTESFFNMRTDFSAVELEKKLREEKKPDMLTGFVEAHGVCCCSRRNADGYNDVVLLDAQFNISGVLLNDKMMGNRMHVYAAEPCPTQAGLFAVRTVKHGAPRCCCVVYDANEGKVLAELDGLFSCSWSKDGSAILYSDAEIDRGNNRNINRVRRYNWRKNQIDTLYEYTKNAVTINVKEGPMGGLILGVKVDYGNTLLLYLAGDGSVTRLNEGVNDVVYLGGMNGCSFFKTNLNAPMGQIVSLMDVEMTKPLALLNAKVVLPQQDALLAAAGVTEAGLLAVHQRNACSELALFTLNGVKKRQISLPDPYGTVSTPDCMQVSDQGRIFFNFSSFILQDQTLAYDIKTSKIVCVHQTAVSKADDLAVQQRFLNARDGTRILVYLICRKDLVLDGNTPVLMYGYGGYASSAMPGAENWVTGINIAEWVRKGRIYAHCILRGGSEYGIAWHEDGMKMTKKHAFTDFIDIAEYLIANGLTRPEKIVASGASNGGLLMAAVTTMRPDLFGTVIASVPHTDMLRFRNDDRGMMYVTEYGDPLDSKEMFEYMASYSPYHNIREGVTYPYIYVQTGKMDNNVPCYHGKKFAVRMQAAANEVHPVLLEVLPHGSHNRGVGDEYFHNIAQIQTFIEIGLARSEE